MKKIASQQAKKNIFVQILLCYIYEIFEVMILFVQIFYIVLGRLRLISAYILLLRFYLIYMKLIFNIFE